MKQDVSSPPTRRSRAQDKPPTAVTFSTTPSRLRSSSSSSTKPKDSESETVIGNNGNRVSPPLFPKPRATNSVNQMARKQPVVVNKPKPKSELDGRREMKELQEKVDQNETLIRNLQSEVLELKADLDKAKRLNLELELHNRKLSEDLAAAEAKIAASITPPPHQTPPTFKDIQKLIATKLEHSKVKNETTNDGSPTRSLVAAPTLPVPVASADLQGKVVPCHLPPPLPPPLPPRATVKAATARKAPAIVQSYRSLTKHDSLKYSSGSGNHDKPVVMSAHSSIVGEIQKRSTHLLAIKTDIETKGDFINSLILKVLDAAYSDIEDVLKFVDWLDDQLLSLADERAVLKHFKWPEKKADAMREAAVEYRGLKLLESELCSHKDDASIPCGVALKKMAGLLDKSEQSIQRLIKLRTSVVLSYQQFKIPIDWMLDSGFISKIKQASMMLAKSYLKRVTTELESVQYLERESTQEGLLLQGIHFAYRAHQFAGGLDSETLCAFEVIRRRVPGHLRESQALLAGIPST